MRDVDALCSLRSWSKRDTMRLSAFTRSMTAILFGRSERRFAKDVLLELGIRPDMAKKQTDQKPEQQKTTPNQS